MKTTKIQSKPKQIRNPRMGMKKVTPKVTIPPAGGDMAQAFDRHMESVKGWDDTPMSMKKERNYDEHLPKSSKRMLGMKEDKKKGKK